MLKIMRNINYIMIGVNVIAQINSYCSIINIMRPCVLEHFFSLIFVSGPLPRIIACLSGIQI